MTTTQVGSEARVQRDEPHTRVISVNVGEIRAVEWRGEIVHTGIWKHPAPGRLALRGVNFAGDDQADRTVHGGRRHSSPPAGRVPTCA